MLLDSGNFSDNPTPAGEIKTRALVDAMGRIGYGAVNVGERELLMGYQEFVRKTEGATFPFVSTNIIRQDTKEPVFKPFTILEVGRGESRPAVRVGVLGVVRFNPLFLKSGPDKSNLVIASPRDMVKRYLPEARRRSDVVVLLAALPRDDARLLAREVPGIDFVMGAYGGAVTTSELKEGDARIVYAGNQGKELGETRLYLEGNKVAASVSYMYNLSARYPDDEAMKQFMNEVASKIGELRSGERQKGEEARAAASQRPYAGTDTCKGCHADEHAQWATTGHARALATLVDKKKDGDLACLTCHATGAGAEGGFRDAQSSPDLAAVGCESCHGPGTEHAAKPAKGYGKIELATCIGCHNRENSPRFDYYSYLPKVQHGAARSPR